MQCGWKVLNEHVVHYKMEPFCRFTQYSSEYFCMSMCVLYLCCKGRVALVNLSQSIQHLGQLRGIHGLHSNFDDGSSVELQRPEDLSLQTNVSFCVNLWYKSILLLFGQTTELILKVIRTVTRMKSWVWTGMLGSLCVQSGPDWGPLYIWKISEKWGHGGCKSCTKNKRNPRRVRKKTDR